MKAKTLIQLCFIFSITCISDLKSQEVAPKLPEYSYTEFFRMIEEEEENIFLLENAIIRYNPNTDIFFNGKSDRYGYSGLNEDSLIIVDKSIDLSNVHFEIFTKGVDNYQKIEGILYNIIFREEVYFRNVDDILIVNCVFDNGLFISKNCNFISQEIGIIVQNCTVHNSFLLLINECINKKYEGIIISNNKLLSKNNSKFMFQTNVENADYYLFQNNSGENIVFNATFKNTNLTLFGNKFLESKSFFDIKISDSTLELDFSKNYFGEIIGFSINNFYPNMELNWEQFKNKTYSLPLFLWTNLGKKYSTPKLIRNAVNDSISFATEEMYNDEMSLKGAFYIFYKSKFNRKSSNEVYVEMKNLETKRFKHLYKEDKSFSNYFEWKINQFLSLFSDYGTKPAKAVVIAVYVIFLFALFYLFFPNSWDEKNKHRIMNRMLFFAKYFKRKDGMKEVFEEEQKPHIMAYEDFKSFMVDSKSEIPPYFVTLSKPIYYFSVANFKVRSKILSRADILKGKWVDLKPRRKAVTSIIMVFWLLGILLYDLFVKFFNALMLSINTFSTLGFGEIPIKGLPRYLAIIQGFIGWFMLTIFSVSLISQLLT